MLKLTILGVLEVEDNDVQTIGVTDEVVIHEVVGLIAGELPHTQVSRAYDRHIWFRLSCSPVCSPRAAHGIRWTVIDEGTCVVV